MSSHRLIGEPRGPLLVIVVANPASNAPSSAALDSIKSALRPFDHLVHFGLGEVHRSKASRELSIGPDQLEEVLSSAQGRFEAAVVLHDDVVLARQSLDMLAEALLGSDALAVGPVSNLAAGNQARPEAFYKTDRRHVGDFAMAWRVERGQGLKQVAALDSFCVAVRVEAAKPVIEASAGLAASGVLGADDLRGRLGLRQDCFVHHEGWHPQDLGSEGRPPTAHEEGPCLVSACLIVKDEEDRLASCLESISDIADQIVVYDTGSTDSTPTLARSLGAEVIEGYWDDDFARARNEALSHCKGAWILWVDADEQLVGEIRALRPLLWRSADKEAFALSIENLTGSGVESQMIHVAVRIFRRSLGHWWGRLHEQVWTLDDRRPLEATHLDLVRIRHFGYMQSAMEGRNKAERNLRLARQAVEDSASQPPDQRAYAMMNLARSLVMAGDPTEAVTWARQAIELSPPPYIAELAFRTIVDCLGALGRYEEALSELERFRRTSSSPAVVLVSEAGLRLRMGEPEAALACLDQLKEETRDNLGIVWGPHQLAAIRAKALSATGRFSEAADALLGALRAAGHLDLHLGELAYYLRQAQRSLDEIPPAIPTDKVVLFLAQARQLSAEEGEPILDACWRAWNQDRRLALATLAAAVGLVAFGPLERALEWSARARGLGLADACPLLAAARNPHLAPIERARAAAVAFASFKDPKAKDELAARISELRGPDRDRFRAELVLLCPNLTKAPHGAPPAPQRPLVESKPTGTRPKSTIRAQILQLAARSPSQVGLAWLGEPTDQDHGARYLWEELARGWSAADAEATIAAWNASWDRTSIPHRFSYEIAIAWEMPENLSRLEWADEVWVPSTWAAGLTRAFGGEPKLIRPGLQSQAFGSARHARGELLVLEVDAQPAHLASTMSLARALIARRPGLEVALLERSASRRGSWGDLEGPLEASRQEKAPIELAPGIQVAADSLRSKLFERALAFASLSQPAWWWPALAEAIAAGVAVVVAQAGVAEELAPRTGMLVPSYELREGSDRVHPDPDSVAEAILKAISDPVRCAEAAEAAAEEARQQLEWSEVARQARRRLEEVAVSICHRRPRTPSPLRLRWVGDVLANHSLAKVNREICSRLAKAGWIDLEVFTEEVPFRSPRRNQRLSELANSLGSLTTPEVEVRHVWPPRLGASEANSLVIIQPWEFGSLPVGWVSAIRAVAAQAWVPTRWLAERYIESGIPPSLVRVVPNGVDTGLYRPEGKRFCFAKPARFRFLFVGGTIWRKGIDGLIDTYLGSFGPKDDVCLVIKSFGGTSFYRNSNLDARIRALADDPDAPKIELIEEELDEEAMAQLYRSCDVLIHPYRGEGFGLPVAEAMASGLPVVVTGAGATSDFVDADCGWLLGAARRPLGGVEGAGPAAGRGYWYLEPNWSELRDLLRALPGLGDELARRGRRGAERIRNSFTWDHAVKAAEEALGGLVGQRAASA